jgi:hypothetical protein
MKTYVLTVSRTFPKAHERAGQPTFFVEKINEVIMPISDDPIIGKKLHTIRGNYPLWEKRIKAINEGKAILSIRYWSGKPYNSKQVEFCQLNEVGLQKLDNPKNFAWASIEGKMINWNDIAKNDGLTFYDFCDWFKVRQDAPMAIIHFTNFRY